MDCINKFLLEKQLSAQILVRTKGPVDRAFLTNCFAEMALITLVGVTVPGILL